MDAVPVSSLQALPLRSIQDAPSRVQLAMDRVTGHIRTHHLKVGDELPSEGEFARELGVSRSVIREAFGALAALNLVDVGNGRRPRVSAINVSVMGISLDHAVGTEQISVQDVWELRRGLEVQSAALAATRRTEEEADHILNLARRMARRRLDLDEVVRCDVAFHSAIAGASHNPLLAQVVTSFGPLMDKAVPAAWSTRTTEQEIDEMLQKHLAVAEAIVERNPEAAMRAMDEHFDRTVSDLLAANQS